MKKYFYQDLQIELSPFFILTIFKLKWFCQKNLALIFLLKAYLLLDLKYWNNIINLSYGTCIIVGFESIQYYQ